MRPRLLDLFSGAGGAAMGYHRAGFYVVGVDLVESPNYCGDEFHQADAITVLEDGLGWMGWLDFDSPPFDAIHASPPCQRYIRGGLSDKTKHPDYLPTVREMLKRTGLPWVIENVPGAPIRADVELCGSMFGLEVRRHRWFEFSEPLTILTPPHDHSYPIAGVYGNAHGKAGAWPGMLPSDLETWSRAMGIDWMTCAELADAIPPAYCQFIGEQLMSVVRPDDAGQPRGSAPAHTHDTSAFPGRSTGSHPHRGGPADNGSSERSLPSASEASDGCSLASNRGQDAAG